MRSHYPKTGICDECGTEGARTEYALIKGRPYSRDREDYRELCKRCHNVYDEVGGSRWRGVVTAREAAGEAPLCACGCGSPVTWQDRKARWHRYVEGHYDSGARSRQPRAPRKPRDPASLPVIRCAHCGAEFRAARKNAMFCSKACKAARRRAEGKDDVERSCHICGAAFRRNRFDQIAHCSRSCAVACSHAGNCPGTETAAAA